MKTRTIGLVCFILFSTAMLQAGNKLHVMYGYKIGQSMSIPKKQFGKPFKAHTFEDGYSYIVYKFADHFVVFEATKERPDLIYAIQIQGKNNPKWLGFNGINLGDPVSKVTKVFGKPDLVREALDHQTKKVMKGIVYYSYDDSRNFSFESTDKVVTSIKVSYGGINETKSSMPDFNRFLAAVRSKDVYRVAEYIASDFAYNTKQQHKLNTSVADALLKDGPIKEIFFAEKTGIAAISDKNITSSAMRLQSDLTGFVYKIKIAGAEYDMFFAKSYEGWVLKYIDRFK